MSNYGQLPFGAAFQPSASAAMPGGFSYPTLPSYASQQQISSSFALSQSHPPGTFPPNRSHTYDAYSANGQRGIPNRFIDGNDRSNLANFSREFSYDPQNPSDYPLSSNSFLGPSPFTAPPPAHSKMSPSSNLPQNAHLDTINHLQPQSVPPKALGISRESSAPLEHELEEGELSSGAMSDGELLADETSGLNDTLHGKLNQQNEPDLYSSKGDYQAAHMLVRELHSWGFGFEDVMAEVTDGEALQKIFKEIGLSTETSPKPRVDSSAQHTLDSSRSTTKKAPPEATSIGNTAAEKSSEYAPTTTSQMNVSQDLNMAQKGSIIPSADSSTPLDRKALIAQKLAAKRAKPPLSIPSAQAPTGKDVEVQAIDKETLAQPPVASLIESNNMTQAVPNQDLSRSSTTMPEVLERERKAQTELARQRMEALKQKVATKQGIIVQANDNSNTNLSSPVENAQEAPADAPRNRQERNTKIETDALSRRESYFSPISQKPMFSIPGLFSMTAPEPDERPRTVSDQQQGGVQSAVASCDADQQVVTMGSIQQSGFSTPSISTNPLEDPTNNSSRKRSQASDFFDSPARIRNPLNQRDAEVIIDISDEESLQSEEGQLIESTYAQSNDIFRSKKQSDPRSLTPAGGGLTQKALPSISTTTTPLVTFTPKGQEPKELKSKELEIELMNRKIAELEATIRARKAKQATNRDQSPGFNGQDAHIGQTAQPLVGNPEASATLNVDNVTDPTISISREVSTSTAEILKEGSVENETSGRDPVPRTDIHYHIADNDAQQTQEAGAVECNAADEAAGQPENLPTSKQDDEQSRLLQPTSPSGLPTSSDQSQVEQEGTAHQSENIITRRRARQAEIEHGLPILNGEIERTRQKLISLREQEIDLEAEIKKGLEGRQMLLDELSRLSQDTAADVASDLERAAKPPWPETQLTHFARSTDVSQQVVRADVNDDGQAQQPIEEIDRAFDADKKPVALERFSPDTPLPDRVATGLAQSELADPPPPVDHDSLSEGELEEDIMDISRSDVDEGEVISDVEGNGSDDYNPGDRQAVPDRTTIENNKEDVVLTDMAVGYAPTMNGKTITLEKPQDGNTVDQDEHMEDIVDLEDEEIYEPPNSFPENDNISIPGSSLCDQDTGEALPKSPPTKLEHAADRSRSDVLSDFQIYEKYATSQASESKRDDDQADQQSLTYRDPKTDRNSEIGDSDEDYEPPEPTALDDSSLPAFPPLAFENVAPMKSSSDADSNDVREMITNSENNN